MNNYSQVINEKSPENSNENTTFIINNYTQENTQVSSKSTLIIIIHNYIEEKIILDESFDKNIENIINKINNSYLNNEQIEQIKNGNYLILIKNNELEISLTTSDYKIYNDKNISSINLGECENQLKQFYNISKNESLLILKFEVKKKDMKIPRIEYEVFFLSKEKKLYKLDLNICNDLNIIIYNSIKLDEKNIDIFNSSSNYYKDICYTYTTQNGTDIILSDRKKEYINNNLSVCEENCNFTDYDYENNRTICSCKVKKELKKYSEININKTLLYNSFTDVNNFMNLNVMKCYKKLFCKNGILNNIGFYIILSIIIIQLICIFV